MALFKVLDGLRLIRNHETAAQLGGRRLRGAAASPYHGLGQRPVRRGGSPCLRSHKAIDQRLAAAVDGSGGSRHQLGQVLVAWLLQRERRA